MRVERRESAAFLSYSVRCWGHLLAVYTDASSSLCVASTAQITAGLFSNCSV